MNTVIVQKTVKGKDKPLQGDIFRDDNEVLYLLSYVGDGYVCITFERAHFWTNPNEDIEKAVAGLTFYKRNAKITIE